jgi:hypothetical protein
VKTRYQKEATKAAEKFQDWAKKRKDPIQVKFPAPDMIELAKEGLGELVRQLGKLFIEEVLETEAEQIAGPRSKPSTKRTAYRWGREQGYCVIDGQKVPIARPRVRSRVHNREIPLGSYELFQRTLDILLAENNVSRAASRLRLSPSAMSRALARLRDATGDPLLVRAGRGLVPTPRALELRDQVSRLHLCQRSIFPSIGDSRAMF